MADPAQARSAAHSRTPRRLKRSANGNYTCDLAGAPRRVDPDRGRL